LGNNGTGKIIRFEDLSKLRRKHPRKKIVHCHGVFDLFHYGHMLHLRSAKKFGDVLVVTLTPDKFVNKGPGRPRYNEQQRALLVASLDMVDYVAINKHPKAMEPIGALKPHFYVKGPDYRDIQKDITGGIREEQDAVKAAGGKLVFTADETESSTELINQFFSQWDEGQRQAIDNVKRIGGLDGALKLIEGFEKRRVLVVGEPIVDTYIFCQAEAISSKSPTVSARLLNQEDYAGGALAIANHLKSLGCDVSLLFTHGGEPYFEELLKRSVNGGIRVEAVPVDGVPTPRKTRFLTPFRAQRIFELIDLRSDQWSHADPADFCRRLKKLAGQHDLIIAADFGHGLFERDVLATLSELPNFLAVNVQTNSGNFGFNPFTKHKHHHYVSIDERECRLAMHDRLTPIEDLARKTVREKIRGAASITLGTAGSLYFDKTGREHLCPTFFKETIDTTGAGDAYFAITALLAQMDAPAPLVPFLGNCFAGLKTRIIGNKSAVAKVDLIRTVQSLLR